MSVSCYVFLGAYFKLSNTTKEVEYVENACPKHGKMKNRFCPHCGQEVKQVVFKQKVKKSWEHGELAWNLDKLPGDYFDRMTDLIIYPYNDSDCCVVKSHGTHFQELPTIDVEHYKNKLKEKYAKYIKWLEEEKFNIEVCFGIFQFYS